MASGAIWAGAAAALLATVAAAAAFAEAFSALAFAFAAASATTPSCTWISLMRVRTSSLPAVPAALAMAVVVASSAASRVSTSAFDCSLASSRARRSISSFRKAKKSAGSMVTFLLFGGLVAFSGFCAFASSTFVAATFAAGVAGAEGFGFLLNSPMSISTTGRRPGGSHVATVPRVSDLGEVTWANSGCRGTDHTSGVSNTSGISRSVFVW